MVTVANRETRSRGGGLALTYKNTLDCKLLEKGHAHTFEHAHWDIVGHNMTQSLLALYHPPPSPKQKHTVNEFVTESVDFLADYLNKFTGDLIIAGDFNIYVNDLFNDDTQWLLSVMEALGFDQLVDFCIQKVVTFWICCLHVLVTKSNASISSQMVSFRSLSYSSTINFGTKSTQYDTKII